nr:ankyrin repeat domain-containing protein [Bacteroidota bacterium]
MLKFYCLILLLAISFSGFSQSFLELTIEGNLEEIKKSMESDPSLVNLKDNEGDIPLCTSIVNRHTELSLFFIENGADLNNQNQDGYMPLHWAALRGDSLIIEALIDKGANLDMETTTNETALNMAASRGYVQVVKILVENNANPEISNDYQRTPLITAARERGGIETIKILVEGGANIDATDFFGDTPLSLAAWRGFEEIVDYLIDKNAQFSASGEEGFKLLTYAADKRLWNLYSALIQKGGEVFVQKMREQPVLHWAAAGGSEIIVGDLIVKNFQVNATDHFNWSPLHYASYFGRLEVAQLLIDNGSDINAKTPIGETPLFLARLENKNEIIDLLISVNADQNPPGLTQLTGEYLGQNKPGKQLELFAPGIISRLHGGHSNITFSADGTEAFWTEYILRDVGYSAGNTVWHSKIRDGVWSSPKKFLSNGDTPFFSPEGHKIFLLSTFELPTENNEIKGIWYYERVKDSLCGPKYLNFDVNNSGLYWQFTFDKNENIYFSTDEGLFRSLYEDGTYLEKENLAEVFHTDYKGGAPYISPDGSFIIFSSRAFPDSYGSLDLYIGFRKPDDTWTKPVNMGPSVNSASQEHLPMVSPDGKYLFIRTERKGVNGIYWMDAKIIEELKLKTL